MKYQKVPYATAAALKKERKKAIGRKLLCTGINSIDDLSLPYV